MHWLLDHKPMPFDQVPPGQAVADDSPARAQLVAQRAIAVETLVDPVAQVSP